MPVADPPPTATPRTRPPQRPLAAAALGLLLVVAAALGTRHEPTDRVDTAPGPAETRSTTSTAPPGRVRPPAPVPDPGAGPGSSTTAPTSGATGVTVLADRVDRPAERPPGERGRPTGTTTPPPAAPVPATVGPARPPAGPAPSPPVVPGSSPTTPATTPTTPSTPTTIPTTPSTTPTTPTTTTPPTPEPLDPDVEGCPNLGLVPIGDTTGAPADVVALGPRLRAVAATIDMAAALVCALPARAWRDDLAVQQLRTAGRPDGVLVTGRTGSYPVLRFTEVEWSSFQFRDGGRSDHNFAGIPVGRMQLGGVEVIRTTRGGLVMERPDSWGFVVVSGAWDVWMDHGGPAGDLGLPRSKPTGRYGLGATQDFTEGLLLLPGVSEPLEAETQPADRYRILPLTAAQRAEVAPPPGSIVQVTGVAYYVDRLGVRHWLATTSDWSCAYWDLGARETEVRGWITARYPLGPVFTCPG